MLERYRVPSPERAQKLNRAGDALLLGAASSAAALQNGTVQWQVALAVLASATACWILVSSALRQYDVDSGRAFFGDLTLTLVMLLAVIVPVSILCLFFPHHVIPGQMGRFIAVLVPAVLLLRVRAVGMPLWRSRSTVDVLIVGVGPFGRLTGAEIRDGDSPRRLLGYLRFDDETQESRLHARVFGSITGEHSAVVQAAIRTCEKLGVPFALPACPYRLTRAKQLAPAGGVMDGYTHFLTVQIKPLQWAMKRLFDILASGAALVILSPLLLTAALLVKLTSHGPVLYKQERVGLHGRTFHMLKFRSMVVNAEEMKARLMAQNEQAGPVFKMKQDPRVTAVGRYLRKHCVWQVSGRNEISFEEWMLLDMRYIDHWSLAADFDLIWRTVPVVLTGRGAS